MSWLYSQVLVAEYSEANSLAGAQSAPSSGNPTRKRIVARQNEGILPPFPIWDDVAPLTERPWRGLVDVVSGGFPCQDISAAGKGAGIDGTRSGLWKEMARIVGQVGPRYVFIENSPMLRTRGLHVVLKDLAEMGYDARWGVLGAVDAGAPHKRDRMWIRAERRNLLSHAEHRRLGWREQQSPCAQETYEELMADAKCVGRGQFGWSHQSLAERQAKGQQVRLNTADYAPEGGRGGSLNPTWVEWLMGWPLGWTDLKPLETDKSQRWPHSHGMS
jgi:site-specific DNA-cytosine methylase